MTIDPSVVAALEAAVMADPQNVPLRLHLAGLMLEGGNVTGAAAQCSVALQLQPDDPEALALAARAAEAAGDGPRAAAYHRLEVALSWPAELASLAAGGHEAVSGDGWDVKGGGEDWDRILAQVLAEEDASASPPALTLADVAGLDDVKSRLERSFLAPLRDAMSGRSQGRDGGRRMSGGMLLWGPPGCGKTFLGQAIAGELGARFLAVGLHDVLEIWLGQSEQNLHSLFQAARRQAPCLMFLDEVDALGHKRSNLTRTGARNVVVQLLAELDGLGAINEGIFVLAATNQLWDVDPALRRPGRLDRTFCVLPPDEAARKVILGYHLRNRPIGAVDLGDAARRTEGFSGADLRLVCDLASERATAGSTATGGHRPIGRPDLLAAIAETRPSTRSWFETARNYVMFANQDGEYDDVKAYLRQHRPRS